MSNRQSILLALKKFGTSTYDDLEFSTGIARDKLRFAINDAKKAGHVTAGKDAVTGQKDYTITPAGLKLIEQLGNDDEQEAPVCQAAKKPAAIPPKIEQRPADAAAVPQNKVDSRQDEIDTLRAQLRHAEQMRDAHFESAEAAAKRIDELLAQTRTLTQRAEASEKNRDDLKAERDQLRTECDEIFIKLGECEQAKEITEAAVGYIIRVAGKKPRICAKPESARNAALSSARAHGRADVLALIPIGKAVRGAEWKEA